MNKLLFACAFFTMSVTAASLAYAGDNQGSVLDDSTYMSPPSEIEPSEVEPKAGETYVDEREFDGFYAGVDLGYNWGSFDVDDSAGVDGDVDLDGIQGGIFVGYGFTHAFDSFTGYLGAELGFEWSDADDDLDVNTYEKKHNFLVTLRPGAVVNDGTNLVYGVIGYTRAEFEGVGSDDDVDGLVLGLGTEIGGYGGLKVRLEYNYVNYDDARLSTTSLEGDESTLKAGIVYHF